ncbi:metabotropic glutamate receptor 8-like protein [Dinothrombium tinctorium]|uniref:Metabotropic glutamate receptor 8-like protein n=1 Tax=Dinothrombium tinctorium TaxID=1965070 RepID=A0A443QM65_9ACAR|nr:metabotropic glutamate receptor 8-like protein [Dinothrombium tinctorium]
MQLSIENRTDENTNSFVYNANSSEKSLFNEFDLSKIGYFNRVGRSPTTRPNVGSNITRPVKRVSEISGDITLGGLMMVHEREDTLICGKIMPQGGIQALECMLYTIDWINNQTDFLPGITLGAYILDDCDKDTYGLEQAVDFIKAL